MTLAKPSPVSSSEFCGANCGSKRQPKENPASQAAFLLKYRRGDIGDTTDFGLLSNPAHALSNLFSVTGAIGALVAWSGVLGSWLEPES